MTPSPKRWITCCVIVLLVCSAALILPAAAITLAQTYSAPSSTPTIANGDPVFVKGIATGHPRNGLQVWFIGYNYLKVSTIPVNDDNTFTFELQSSDTRTLAQGQYFVVIQYPMMNGQFDVIYDSATGAVTNRQLGTNGKTIFQLSGSGSLQSPSGAQALVNAISSQNIDDTFTTYSFIIGQPTAIINPIGDHYVGDQFAITGSTNLAVGDNLMIEITSSSFKPTSKVQAAEFSGSAGTVKIEPGNGALNRWSFPVDASGYRPDEYIVKVSGITLDVTGSTTFNIVEKLPATLATPTPVTPPITTVATPLVVTTGSPATVPATRKSPVSVWTGTGALALALIALRVKRNIL